MKKIERLSISANCYSVLKKDLDALEAELEEATNLIKAVCKWNNDYPSGRIYSHGQIVGIANEMDIIFEQCKCFLKQADPPQEAEG